MYINTDHSTDELITYLNQQPGLRHALSRLTGRELSAIRQTIYHTIERAYLAGYDDRLFQAENP